MTVSLLRFKKPEAHPVRRNPGKSISFPVTMCDNQARRAAIRTPNSSAAPRRRQRVSLACAAGRQREAALGASNLLGIFMKRFGRPHRNGARASHLHPAEFMGRALVLSLLLGGASFGTAQSKPVEKEQKTAPAQKELSRSESKAGDTATLRIEVTAGDDGKPVDSASIYVRYVIERKLAKDKKVEQNWKTSREGVVKVPDVPKGKVLIQVIAPKWKTFGQWYDIKEDEEVIKIRLQKPPQWY
jgi:hypothetical protein